MKLSNPRSRHHLKIGRKEKVLEVGGGSNPHPRSNVVTDKHLDSNYHRDDDLRVYPHQKFVEADGTALNFADKEFDYLICNHVLEHVDDPEAFVRELARVSKRGYLETPSLIGEILHPMESHRWVILEIDEKIVLYDKETLGFNQSIQLHNLFLNHLLNNSLTYRLFDRTYPYIRRVMYEWKDEIEILVNPNDPYYRKYFENWNSEIVEELVPTHRFGKELLLSSSEFSNMVLGFLGRKFFKKEPKPLRDYA